MQTKLTLGKTTTSHYQVPIAKNANGNTPERILIVYLNKNLPDCNENLGVGKQEPLVLPYAVWYKTKGEKEVISPFKVNFL